MLYFKFKAIVNKFKEKFERYMRLKGYDFRLEQQRSIHLTTENLLESRYYIQTGFQNKAIIQMDLPVNLARSLSGRNYYSLDKHHAVLALQYALKSATDRKGIESALYNYFVEFTIPQHKTIASLSDLYGISLPQLNHYPPWVLASPWYSSASDNISEQFETLNLSTYVENSKRGFGIDAKNGGSQFVFTASERARLETKLISQLYHSISKKGFNRAENSKDPIGAKVLIDGNRFAWIINAGIHRVCVLKALGHNEIPVVVRGVIYKEDVKYWPGVRSGLFTKEQATEIFDTILNGNKTD